MTLPVTVRSTTFHAPDVHADIAPSGVDSNLLAADISDVLKYFEFVLIRISSIRADAPTYHALTKAHLADFTNLENRQVRLDLQRSIESDVEGLILFAVMALDRAARFTEQFFGPASKEWSTFNSFKYLEGYAAAHGLTSPEPELLEDIKWLEEHVVSFRHFYLAHRQEGSDRPRYSIGVSVHTKTGAISYGVQSVSYPTNNENPYTNMPIEEVVTVLERFIHEWLAYIDANVVSANSTEN